MATYEVEVRVAPWEEGGFRAEAVGLRGCWAVADTMGQAIDDIREVLRLWIEASREHNMTMPPDLAGATDVRMKVLVPVAAE